jgi:hypothetical protein
VEFRKSKVVSLEAHPTLDEEWLQGLLADDPSLLGLGDNLTLSYARPRQPRTGRPDLIFYDPEANTRYEVEVQLGPTDEAHIIRTIEYRDSERSRYPQYEHVAVLVAEDVTSTVLDLGRHGTDEDDDAGQATDRQYWTDKASAATVALAEEMLGIANQVTRRGLSLKYNKTYIGLAKDGIPENLVVFHPRKKGVLAEFKINQTDEVSALVEGAGIEQYDYYARSGQLVIPLENKAAVAKHRALIADLIRRASRTHATAQG